MPPPLAVKTAEPPTHNEDAPEIVPESDGAKVTVVVDVDTQPLLYVTVTV